MPHLKMSVPRTPAVADRRSRTFTGLAIASFALLALSLAPADGAPLRNHNHHKRAGYAEAMKARAALPAAGWTTGRGKPFEAFGQKVDP